MLKVNIGEIKVKQKINIGEIKLGIKKVNPPLENLEITPSGVEQNFKSEEYYGYDEIKVKAVASGILQVTPLEEEQQITGLFGIVKVDKIPNEYVVPKVENNLLILSRAEIEGGVLSI